MDCRDYERLLYLNRGGERTAQAEESLAQHLALCPRCRETQARIAEAENVLNAVRQFSPSLRDPAGLTESIMEHIPERAAGAQRRSVDSVIDRLLDFFVLPLARYATALTVVVATGTFCLQYLATLASVTRLEQTFAGHPAVPTAPQVTFAVPLREIRNAPQLQDIAKAAGRTDEKNSRFLIDGRTVFAAGGAARDLPLLAVATPGQRAAIGQLGKLGRHLYSRASIIISF